MSFQLNDISPNIIDSRGLSIEYDTPSLTIKRNKTIDTTIGCKIFGLFSFETLNSDKPIEYRLSLII